MTIINTCYLLAWYFYTKLLSHLKTEIMNKGIRILVTVGACMAVGAALGMLFAPEEGVETRKKIIKRGRKLAGVVNDSIDEGKESLEEIKDVLSKQLNKVNRKLEEIKF
jgi:gas vesicle protein